MCTAGAALLGQIDMEEAWVWGDLGSDSPVLYPGRAVGLHAGWGGSRDTLHRSHLWGMVGAGVSQGLGNGMAMAGQLECLHCAPTPAIKVEWVTQK